MIDGVVQGLPRRGDCWEKSRNEAHFGGGRVIRDVVRNVVGLPELQGSKRRTVYACRLLRVFPVYGGAVLGIRAHREEGTAGISALDGVRAGEHRGRAAPKAA